jgi:hypothetical protein
MDVEPRTMTKQKRARAANKLERMSTPTNPKVKPAGLSLSAAEAKALVRALRS